MSCLTLSCQCHLKLIQYIHVGLLTSICATLQGFANTLIKILVTMWFAVLSLLVWTIVTPCCLESPNQILNASPVFNAAKLVLTVNCWRVHGSPLLTKLHWLPMEKRIQFKTLLYVFLMFEWHCSTQFTFVMLVLLLHLRKNLKLISFPNSRFYDLF